MQLFKYSSLCDSLNTGQAVRAGGGWAFITQAVWEATVMLCTEWGASAGAGSCGSALAHPWKRGQRARAVLHKQVWEVTGQQPVL